MVEKGPNETLIVVEYSNIFFLFSTFAWIILLKTKDANITLQNWIVCKGIIAIHSFKMLFRRIFVYEWT